MVVAFYEIPEYKYAVRGLIYTNSHGSCNELFNELWSARNSSQYALRYPLNGKVAFHYCPNKPELAVLETNFDRSGLVGAALFILVTILFLAGFVFGWRIRWRFRTSTLIL